MKRHLLALLHRTRGGHMFHEVRKRIEGTQDSHAMSDQEMEQWYRFIQNAIDEAKMSGRNNPRGYPRFANRVANRFLKANVPSSELDKLFYVFQKELGVSALDEEDLEIRRGGVMRFRYRGRANHKANKNLIEFLVKRRGYQISFLDDQWKTGYYNMQITRVANRFLKANRAMPTSFRLVIDNDSELVGRNLKELRKELYDALIEMHAYGLGFQSIEIDNRLRVDRDGTINFDYRFTDGNGDTRRYALVLELWAENKSMRTSERAKPLDISDFKKMLEGDNI